MVSSGFGSGTYKYYIRRFQDGSTRTSMTVNVGKTLVNWNSTSDGVAVGLILKSGTSGEVIQVYLLVEYLTQVQQQVT